MLERVDADRVAMAPELLGELGQKIDAPPELVAVAEIPPDRLDRIRETPQHLVVVWTGRPAPATSAPSSDPRMRSVPPG